MDLELMIINDPFPHDSIITLHKGDLTLHSQTGMVSEKLICKQLTKC